MPQSNTQPASLSKRATIGFVLSLVGGLLILLRGIVRIVAGDVITFVGSDEVRHRFLAGLALNIIGGIAVVFGILIIIGAYLIYNRMETAGGIIVIMFSVLSIFVGSGWLIGLILGLIGAVLAFFKK
ncbi:MAG TPA: hypothetical protein VLU95_05190 [Candidatus Acidoferrum sp.]|nr:hypothetical protein [Candidatus Acidoferrum sp.]